MYEKEAEQDISTLEDPGIVAKIQTCVIRMRYEKSGGVVDAVCRDAVFWRMR